MSYYHWLGREAEGLLPPECDGDFLNEETVEDDGDITLYFSGPIRPINN